ncbi:MAG TPA: hypothetical protein VMK12_21695 [Anaeromyxobacteraceae bacterium]|nr:hypothetical protein [Anaeromyxobacteraceae bacterium]
MSTTKQSSSLSAALASPLDWWSGRGQGEYPTGINVSGATMDALLITGDQFDGEWNYTVQS